MKIYKKIIVTMFIGILFGCCASVCVLASESESDYNVCFPNSKCAFENKYMLNNEAVLLEKNGNSAYYLSDNKILKVVVRELDRKNFVNSNAENREKEVEVYFYETKELSENDVRMYASGSLTRSDEAMNPSGNIKAKLSVNYSWTTVNSKRLLRLISATSSYKVIVAEGVVPQTCNLYWRVQGDIYKNGSIYNHGELGDNKSYTTPTFSNVTLMSSAYKVDPTTAGVSYTLRCSRSVTITVSLSFI